VALVTGASRGLGRAIAIALARQGIAVAVNYANHAEGAQAVVEEIGAGGGRARAFRADVASAADIASMLVAIEAELGVVDVLVNNAGIGPAVALEVLDEQGWEHVLRVNLTSAFLVSQAVIPAMRRIGFGRLVFMSSVAARVGGVISAAYAASKAGVEGLAHYYATHLAAAGITSNCIAPAFIETDMIRGAGVSGAAASPMGRFGKAEEVAAVAELLVRVGFINGQTLHVNAGRYMT
jgi:3-oxoacyl-[acyl-carrier protein] reductase